MSKALIWFLTGVGLMAAVMGTVWATTSEEVEVRVNARQLEDGRVEVGIQYRDGGSWSERQLPAARFLSADAQPGQWRLSSATTITTTPATTADAASPEAEELFCLVTHEGPGDEAFWWVVRVMSERWQVYHPGIKVDVMGAPDPADQAAYVRQCVADGATAIGVTLADPAAMKEALLE
ncbi:MAG: hypothetical protein OXG42_09555, partial [Chloroflexi bacterium]|nr:hypothetical protein [Chloroflexota bacterium]